MSLNVKQASIDQLEFEQTELRSHAGRSETRTGYLLTAVSGVRLPEATRLAYVVGQGTNGESYVYVVIWPSSSAAEPQVFDVDSTVAAKEVLLAELKLRLQEK